MPPGRKAATGKAGRQLVLPVRGMNAACRHALPLADRQTPDRAQYRPKCLFPVRERSMKGSPSTGQRPFPAGGRPPGRFSLLMNTLPSDTLQRKMFRASQRRVRNTGPIRRPHRSRRSPRDMAWRARRAISRPSRAFSRRSSCMSIPLSSVQIAMPFARLSIGRSLFFVRFTL